MLEFSTSLTSIWRPTKMTPFPSRNLLRHGIRRRIHSLILLALVTAILELCYFMNNSTSSVAPRGVPMFGGCNRSSIFMPGSRLVQYQYLMNEKEICAMKNTKYFICINSHPDHLDKRNTLRRTWLNPSYLDSFHAIALFFIGIPPMESSMSNLIQESSLYHDLIQADFEDSYLNLSLKTLSCLTWAKTFCESADFVMKVDDDVLVDLRKLQQLLKNSQDSKLLENRIVCKVIGKRISIHRNWGKLCFTYEEYPSVSLPDHCHGFAVVFPFNLIGRLLQITQTVRYTPNEDFFVTGILAKKGGIEHFNMDDQFLVRPNESLSFCSSSKTMAAHFGYFEDQTKGKEVFLRSWSAIATGTVFGN